MARPRGGEWLFDEFQDLAMAGVTVVVSMLTDAEIAELGLEREADAAEAAGLEFTGSRPQTAIPPKLVRRLPWRWS